MACLVSAELDFTFFIIFLLFSSDILFILYYDLKNSNVMISS